MAKPSEVMFEAAKYIAEHGHYKHDLYGPHGEACISGALGRIMDMLKFDTKEVPHWDKICVALNAELGFPTSQMLGEVVDWNDRPGTSAEDVILTLKRAGAKLQEEGE